MAKKHQPNTPMEPKADIEEAQRQQEEFHHEAAQNQHEVVYNNTVTGARRVVVAVMGEIAMESMTMQQAGKELGKWWNGLTEEEKRSLAKSVNDKAQQIKMIAEGVASEVYVLTSGYL